MAQRRNMTDQTTTTDESTTRWSFTWYCYKGCGRMYDGPLNTACPHCGNHGTLACGECRKQIRYCKCYEPPEPPPGYVLRDPFENARW